MTAHLGIGQIEDQPAFAHVRVREAELVANEGPQLLRLGRIEHRVHAGDHGEVSLGYSVCTNLTNWLSVCFILAAAEDEKDLQGAGALAGTGGEELLNFLGGRG